MKKIICAICGFSMICGSAFAAPDQITASLNVPVWWYLQAIASATVSVAGVSEDKVYGWYTYIDLKYVGDNETGETIVYTTPGEIIKQCTRNFTKKEKAKKLCPELVLTAVKVHNKIAETLVLRQGNGSISNSKEVTWNPYDIPRALRLKGEGWDDTHRLKWKYFAPYMEQTLEKVNYIASLDFIREKCISFMQNYDWQNDAPASLLLDKSYGGDVVKICDEYCYNLSTYSSTGIENYRSLKHIQLDGLKKK